MCYVHILTSFSVKYNWTELKSITPRGDFRCILDDPRYRQYTALLQPVFSRRRVVAYRHISVDRKFRGVADPVEEHRTSLAKGGPH